MTNLSEQKHSKMSYQNFANGALVSPIAREAMDEMQRNVVVRRYCTAQLASPDSATPFDNKAWLSWCTEGQVQGGRSKALQNL